MAIRIRVYPQNGAAGYGAYNPYARTSLTRRQLQNERRTNKMRLQYERALWRERMKLVQMQSQVRFGGLGGLLGVGRTVGQYPVMGAYAGAYGLGGVYATQPMFGAFAGGMYYGRYC